MRLRFEQSLREGGVVAVLSTFVLPLWLIGASVHRAHWGTLTEALGWTQFVLSWSGLLWGGGLAFLLAAWSAFAELEDVGRWGQLWARTLCGTVVLLAAVFLSVPGWIWAGELVGSDAQLLLLAILKSLFVPFVVLLLSNLQSIFLPAYEVVIGSTLGIVLLTGWMWADLLG